MNSKQIQFTQRDNVALRSRLTPEQRNAANLLAAQIAAAKFCRWVGMFGGRDSLKGCCPMRVEDRAWEVN